MQIGGGYVPPMGLQRTKRFANKYENFPDNSHFFAKMNEAKKCVNYAKFRENAICENFEKIFSGKKIQRKPLLL